MAEIHHVHCYGSRGEKYSFLESSDIKNTQWESIQPQSPFHLLIPQDTDLLSEYESGWKITEIMPVNSVGIATARDKFTIHWSKEKVWEVVSDFIGLEIEEAREKYKLGKDVQDWKVDFAQDDLRKSGPVRENIQSVFYRPFDIRYTYYTGNSRGFHCRARGGVMQHMLAQDNIALITSRLTKGEVFKHAQVSNSIVEVICMSPKTSNNGFVFPLYCLPMTVAEKRMGVNAIPNFSKVFIESIRSNLGSDIKPFDIFSYIYSILHSPSYRNRYKEFLKIDFPKIPLTKNVDKFYELSQMGADLVDLHLMRSNELDTLITSFQDEGNRTVAPGHPKYKNGKVFINKQGDGFTGVPEEVWNFHVGGYQVCHKWLKDRKGRTLSDDDILHYQRIVVALKETIILMQKIDEAIPSWPIE